MTTIELHAGYTAANVALPIPPAPFLSGRVLWLQNWGHFTLGPDPKATIDFNHIPRNWTGLVIDDIENNTPDKPRPEWDDTRSLDERIERVRRIRDTLPLADVGVYGLPPNQPYRWTSPDAAELYLECSRWRALARWCKVLTPHFYLPPGMPNPWTHPDGMRVLEGFALLMAACKEMAKVRGYWRTDKTIPIVPVFSYVTLGDAQPVPVDVQNKLLGMVIRELKPRRVVFWNHADKDTDPAALTPYVPSTPNGYAWAGGTQ